MFFMVELTMEYMIWMSDVCAQISASPYNIPMSLTAKPLSKLSITMTITKTKRSKKIYLGSVP